MQSAWQDTMEDVRELRGTLELLQRRLFPIYTNQLKSFKESSRHSDMTTINELVARALQEVKEIEERMSGLASLSRSTIVSGPSKGTAIGPRSTSVNRSRERRPD